MQTHFALKKKEEEEKKETFVSFLIEHTHLLADTDIVHAHRLLCRFGVYIAADAAVAMHR